MTYRVDVADLFGGVAFAPNLFAAAVIKSDEDRGTWSVTLDVRELTDDQLSTRSVFNRPNLIPMESVITQSCALAFSRDLQSIYLNCSTVNYVVVVPLSSATAAVDTWHLEMDIYDLAVGETGTPSEGMLFASSLACEMVVWDIAGRRELFRDDRGTEDGCQCGAALSPDGRKYALLDEGDLFVWDLDRMRETGNAPPCRRFDVILNNNFHWSPDSAAVVGSLGVSDIVLFDTRTRATTRVTAAPLKLRECVTVNVSNEAGGHAAYAVVAGGDDDIHAVCLVIGSTHRVLSVGRARISLGSISFSRENNVLCWQEWGGTPLKYRVKMVRL